MLGDASEGSWIGYNQPGTARRMAVLMTAAEALAALAGEHLAGGQWLALLPLLAAQQQLVVARRLAEPHPEVAQRTQQMVVALQMKPCQTANRCCPTSLLRRRL